MMKKLSLNRTRLLYLMHPQSNTQKPALFIGENEGRRNVNAENIKAVARGGKREFLEIYPRNVAERVFLQLERARKAERMSSCK